MRLMENAKQDLLLSELRRMAEALNVLPAELLLDLVNPLRMTKVSRDRCLRIMKTVRGLERQPPTQEAGHNLGGLVRKLCDVHPAFRTSYEESAWCAERTVRAAKRSAKAPSLNLDAERPTIPMKIVYRFDPEKPLHQLQAVRDRQGMSVRKIAGNIGSSISIVQAEEEPGSDLLVSQLYRYQIALEVPLIELIEEPNDKSESSVGARASLVQVIKFFHSIRNRDGLPRRYVKLLDLFRVQICELIEDGAKLFREISPWPSVGHRRSTGEVGRIAEHSVPDQFLLGPSSELI